MCLTSYINNPYYVEAFFVRQKKALKRINPEDVVMLSIEGNDTWIQLGNNMKYMARSTLVGSPQKLPSEIFFTKVHRSYTLNVYNGESGNNTIPIGKEYYKELIERLDVID